MFAWLVVDVNTKNGYIFEICEYSKEKACEYQVSLILLRKDERS
jgi:hypothetical protein